MRGWRARRSRRERAPRRRGAALRSTSARAFLLVSACAALAAGGWGCTKSSMTQPSSGPLVVRVVFRGSTTRRADLPASAQGCVDGVGVTHTHPGWRNFAAVPLTPLPPDRYEITFTDVPINARVAFRINDQNFCDQNPTGAVVRNVSANDVELAQNTTTPGNGEEPGFAFMVSATGRVTQ